MVPAFSQKKLYKIGQIEQIVRNYFVDHPAVTEVFARDLMDKFISKEIFFKNYGNGLPIRQLLNQLEEGKQLDLFKYIKVIRNEGNGNWYFKKHYCL